MPTRLFSGDGLMARAARTSAFVLAGFGAAQLLRLASNIILTRLLFPEAFGLMALITLISVGLNLFSDVGIIQSISHNKRGDDPDFLNTAWTLQAIRGVGLWIAASALAYPFSLFYDTPELALYLPISAFSLVIMGLRPTRVPTAFRHLQLGRVTLIELSSQFISLVFMIVVALLTHSVAALVAGGVLQSILMVTLSSRFLKGHRDRFRWERSAARELFHFGKWIFLSTLFGFFASQGDKLVFGKFLTLEMLGIYNVGYYLGSFPLMLGTRVVNGVMIPIYRDMREKGTPQTVRKIKRMRYLMTAGVIGLLIALAYGGPALVGFLYDSRYHDAGAMIVLIGVALAPQAIWMTYDRSALAAGDSRRFFVTNAAQGVFQVLFLLLGAYTYGIVGAIAGMGVARTVVYPFLVWLAVKHKVWDWVHDTIFWVVTVVLGAGAIWMHLDLIRELAAI